MRRRSLIVRLRAGLAGGEQLATHARSSGAATVFEDAPPRHFALQRTTQPARPACGLVRDGEKGIRDIKIRAIPTIRCKVRLADQTFDVILSALAP